MKRLVAGLVTLTVTASLVVWSQTTPDGRAQDRSPLVGSWEFVDGPGGTRGGFLYTFLADGAIIATDSDGLTYHGAWQSFGAGEVTFDLKALTSRRGGQGYQGRLLIAGSSDEIPFGSGTLRRIVPPSLADVARPGTPMPLP